MGAVRAIKRWASHKTDPPPLDSPPLMASWWTRNFSIRVPAKILAYAVGQPHHSAANESTPSPVDDVDVPTLAESLGDLRRNVALCKAELDAARASGNPHSIALANRNYALAFDTLLKGERLTADLGAADRANLSQSQIDLQINGFMDRLKSLHDYLPQTLIEAALRHAASQQLGGKAWIRARRSIIRAADHFAAAAVQHTKDCFNSFRIACQAEPMMESCRRWIDDLKKQLSDEEQVEKRERLSAAQP
jgi:hypothetical protein